MKLELVTSLTKDLGLTYESLNLGLSTLAIFNGSIDSKSLSDYVSDDIAFLRNNPEDIKAYRGSKAVAISYKRGNIDTYDDYIFFINSKSYKVYRCLWGYNRYDYKYAGVSLYDGEFYVYTVNSYGLIDGLLQLQVKDGVINFCSCNNICQDIIEKGLLIYKAHVR